MRPPIFVVSTGRSGSTLLSNALRNHHRVTSVSEFFSALDDRSFNANVAVLDQLTVPHPIATLLYAHHLEYPEMLYRIDDSVRFSRNTGVPPLLCTVLPHLTARPEPLFDELVAELSGRISGVAPARGYLEAWRWLCSRLGGDVVVERSGGNIQWIRRLAREYPDAKFVHVYRDGYETALSMSKHNGFRLFALRRRFREQLGYDPFVRGPVPNADDLPRDLRTVSPDRFDPEAFQAFKFELPEFVRLWTSMVTSALAPLKRLPPERLLHIRYEDVLARPDAIFPRLATFVCDGETDDAWVESSVSLVRPRGAPPQTRSADEATLRWLQRGEQALAQLGVA